MQFRPCIDIHNGKVKQIVGSSLKDEGDVAVENFVSNKGADYYANIYKEKNLPGGHVILLNSKDSPYYAATKEEAFKAFAAFKNGLMAGGGINDENAAEFLDAGASHVIVTSFVFKDGHINMDNLNKLVNAVGRDRIVLDLSCKRKPSGDDLYVVTDRWQKYTDTKITKELFDELSSYCAEFLVHAADVEGKSAGIDEGALSYFSKINHVITYAGGISSYDDIRLIDKLTNGQVNFTVGSKLDLFGGSLTIEGICECIQ